jgi:hypothetical protein
MKTDTIKKKLKGIKAIIQKDCKNCPDTKCYRHPSKNSPIDRREMDNRERIAVQKR